METPYIKGKNYDKDTKHIHRQYELEVLEHFLS